MKNLIKLNRQFMNQKITIGKFIVLEGLDRSGKTSLSKFLEQKVTEMTQKQTILTGFPNRSTKIGLMINQFLRNKIQMSQQAIHLLFSANRWECIGQIKQSLKQGKNIICDRYWYSGVAYSAAKGLDYSWCIGPDQKLYSPDLIIYLKGDVNILSQRQGFGNQRFQKVQFQKKVGQNFDRLMKDQLRKYPYKVKIIQLGSKSQLDVQNQVEQIIKSYLNENNQVQQ